LLKKPYGMLKNRDGEWKKEKALVMHGAALSVPGGEEEIVSYRYGQPHEMLKIMQGK